jgi:hypothetical protein
MQGCMLPARAGPVACCRFLLSLAAARAHSQLPAGCRVAYDGRADLVGAMPAWWLHCSYLLPAEPAAARRCLKPGMRGRVVALVDAAVTWCLVPPPPHPPTLVDPP